ncbi:complex I NDUFA9 subunit family protein [Sinorhizobium terangae]|uniref:complex I NDUFA9 subunit family protein n=1 Tax=Sinorhizobium terangae TaxID=110322 RepID=UPI0024B18D19|nr:complex I NDUFA9 subunit family protein [Sinorhizobium terangae]WFU51556.1 complex I NDUFA9 subunit family protein [Sinorhizobium terangae]
MSDLTRLSIKDAKRPLLLSCVPDASIRRGCDIMGVRALRQVVDLALLRESRDGGKAGGNKGDTNEAAHNQPPCSCGRNITLPPSTSGKAGNGSRSFTIARLLWRPFEEQRPAEHRLLTGVELGKACPQRAKRDRRRVAKPWTAKMINQPGPNDPVDESLVTVFGGTGFLGRRIVSRLLETAVVVRAASRHPRKNKVDDASGERQSLQVEADILDPSSMASAVAGSRAVVNAVSLYVERGEQTFERVHVEAAADLAAASRDAGVERFIQISGIGANATSRSPYIRARGRGEEAVKAAFPGAVIVRPAVMTGPDDAFITTIARLVRLLPIYPLFGEGSTRVQPVHVEDVAEAVSRLALGRNPAEASIFECAGPRIYSYRELVREIAAQLNLRVRTVPVPFAVWSILATASEFLPAAPVTRNQVDLMRFDNVATRDLPGLKELEIQPRGIEDVIRMIEHAA